MRLAFEDTLFPVSFYMTDPLCLLGLVKRAQNFHTFNFNEAMGHRVHIRYGYHSVLLFSNNLLYLHQCSHVSTHAGITGLPCRDLVFCSYRLTAIL